MRKFKEGDEIVRTANFWWHAPEGWASKVANGNKYIDKHGDLMQIVNSDWELAEGTSKPVFTSGEKVFIAQMNPHAGVESKRYYHAQFWCNSGHQRQYVELGLLFNNKKDAESKCRELVGLPPAPIDLIDGNAYMFDYHKNRKPAIGVYSASNNTFLTVSDDHFVFNCTNIRPMTVAESK
jgi:hypothetical protein